MSRMCPNCSTVNTDTAMLCSKCKAPLNVAANFIAGQDGVNQKKMVDKTSKILVGVIIAVIVVIIALLCVFLFSSYGSNDSSDETVSPAKPAQWDTLGGSMAQIDGINNMQPEGFDSFVHVSKLEFSQNSIELEIGESVQLNVNVFPDNASVKTVDWYSTDTNIVIVDEYGYLTAIENGKAEVYAVSRSDESIMTQCSVVIKNREELVSPESIADYGIYYVTSKLSLRYGPDVDYNEIKLIREGENVRVLAFYTDENSNSWAYVDYGRFSGWVFSKFLSEENPYESDESTSQIDEDN